MVTLPIRLIFVVTENFTFDVVVPHKVVPVKYMKGSNQDILNGIPTVHKRNVEPGFIQFRAFNSVGLPNALCPGVKYESHSSSNLFVTGAIMMII